MKIKIFLLASRVFALSAALLISNAVYAQPISLYEQPDQTAKIVGTADSATGIIPIYTPTNSGDWIKAADPRNGNVGWVKTSDLKSVNGQSNSVTITQKIISDGNQPATYQIIPSGNKSNLTDAQMQAYVQKMRAEQQVIQNSFAGMLKNMNDLFQREWNMWNTQGGFPMIMPTSNGTQPNQPMLNNQPNPQPVNVQTTKPVK